MLAVERRKQILEQVHKDKKVIVSELSRQFRAAESIEQYNADKVFFSCKGLDIQKGVTEGNDETGCIKQSMIKSAKKVYLTVDSSKFDTVGFYNICPLSGLDVVVTDKKPDERWMQAFEENGIQCIYPKETGEAN